MALSQTYTIDCYGTNVAFLDSYIQVAGLSGTKELNTIYVSFFKDNSKNTQIDAKTYTFTPDLESTSNFIAQAYDYLKTLPEYANAVDC